MGRNAEPFEEWEDARDDDMAALICGRDELDDIYVFFILMRQRNGVTLAVHDHYRAKLNRITHALQVGRRNTTALRSRQSRR